MDTQQSWWFCLKHNRVEPEDGCAGKNRLGPYASQEEAAHALETVHQRNEEWDAAGGDDGD
jgi:hypothetical protein